MDLKVLHNANVYIEGTNFAGKVKEVDLPDVKPKTINSDGLGLFGTVKMVVGLDPLELKLKGFSHGEFSEVVSNPFTAKNVQVRGTVATWTSQGREVEMPVVAFATGIFTDTKIGGIKPRESADSEATMTCSYYKLTVEGSTILEIDVINNIYTTPDGEMLSGFKGNLGL